MAVSFGSDCLLLLALPRLVACAGGRQPPILRQLSLKPDSGLSGCDACRYTLTEPVRTVEYLQEKRVSPEPDSSISPMGSPPARCQVGAVWEQAETLIVSACTKLALFFRRRQKTIGNHRLPSFILSCYPRSLPTGRSLDAPPHYPSE